VGGYYCVEREDKDVALYCDEKKCDVRTMNNVFFLYIYISDIL
jgi:hypothetical protein